MKTLYIECNMGVAGDMLMGALLELIENREEFINKMNHLGIPDVKVESHPSIKCGITGTHVSVIIDGEEEEAGEHHHEHGEMHDGRDGHEKEHADHHSHEHHHSEKHMDHHDHEHHHREDHHHHHASMESIRAIIDSLDIAEKVKTDVKNIYEIIAEAESSVHGKPVTEVHFHEVGMMDAIADITGCCMLIDMIHPDKIVVTPVKTGFGHVHCAHGIMPVPAPATALILKRIPSCSGKIEGELCTPTGAALVKYFADEFGYQPEMATDKIGYGMGKKDFPAANCVRVVLGETNDSPCKNSKEVEILKETWNMVANRDETSDMKNQVVELCCNLDDMTPEEIGYATEALMSGKALDVYTTPISMKKNRPGTLLSVLCHIENKDEMVREIFKHTTTIGIREYHCNRYVLRRSIETRDTELGTVRIKKSEGYGVKREKPEYEDLKKIAEESGKTLEEVKHLYWKK